MEELSLSSDPNVKRIKKSEPFFDYFFILWDHFTQGHLVQSKRHKARVMVIRQLRNILTYIHKRT